MFYECTEPVNKQIAAQFGAVRARTLALTSGLSAEDMMLQSMPDASPTKWHLAHTTWFFEEFILKPHCPNYTVFQQNFNYLFNSYYNAVGSRHPRAQRGLLSRPGLSQVLDFRHHVDDAIEQLLAASDCPKVQSLVTTGLHHEMQHQELILTDIKHALWLNPAADIVPNHALKTIKASPKPQFCTYPETLTTIGTSGAGFHYDCEAPAHQVFISAFSLRDLPISNGEWLNFIQDGGYQTPGPWLSDGWDLAQREQWQAPLYWHPQDKNWQEFTLHGWQPLDPAAPVCHISFYEADAFCRWAGWRLPTEFEWEYAARQQNRTVEGEFAESGHWQPGPATQPSLFGNVWQWTSSAYAPYPGFSAEQGALGEYNGKFMANQFVLRGGSCATAQAQMRHSYRNFFHPHQRWQFSGVRPAKNNH
ncbi:ergothioneine biosynthesis protein EgtB [Gilvimarinus sp. 1_MG-2023]|uniref:ergothioneine biosynthesis protein EgtB n=1 Tax=Gilvimarinus sp. 1_MG-2023 TaxID=3062638 RepID=UPI0026E19918|nr:ergothioneine biosynthesis protein EgtB [Gilvimarinus sp. 1_MG-2023]MDO6746052.1 ergothioneine biosynthesis protein EgtB [Gilvimarinus sp. 1_MG-2023]